MLPFLNENLRAKNQRYRCITFIYFDDQSTLQSDWTRALFCLHLVKQNFLRYDVCIGIQRILRSFILSCFQQNLMTKFHENSRKPILGQCSVFFVDFRTHFFKLFGKPASHTFYEQFQRKTHICTNVMTSYKQV